MPDFGRRSLESIRPSEVQGWVSAMNDEGLSASRIRQATIVLRQVMDAAVQDRLIGRNPCERIKLPRLKQEEAAYFDPATVDRIVSTIEKEATRFAESLDDYDHVTVTDIGGWGPIGFWLVVHDHRLDLDYEIASHCDYWDFVGALMNHRQFASLPLQKEVA